MNVMIFAIKTTKRPQYLAISQCGTKHGPYVKVASIPPCCPSCDEKFTAKNIAKHAI
jgi:hypothetical protein